VATTLDDARITVKIDVQAALDQADRLRTRRPGPPRPGEPGQPALPDDDALDRPQARDDRPGFFAGPHTLGAAALASIPGLGLARRAAVGVLALEGLQSVASRFAGFFHEAADEARKSNEGRNIPDVLRRQLLDWQAQILEKVADAIGKAEAAVRVALTAAGYAIEGLDFFDSAAALGADPDPAEIFRIQKARFRYDWHLQKFREKLQQRTREESGRAMFRLIYDHVHGALRGGGP
jgi:hypothetical protein